MRGEKSPRPSDRREERPEEREPDTLEDGLDESLELTYPASDPPRPVRIRPDSDTGSGRRPVNVLDRGAKKS